MWYTKDMKPALATTHASGTSFRFVSHPVRSEAGEIMYHRLVVMLVLVKEENPRAKPPTPRIVKTRKRHNMSPCPFMVQKIQKQQESVEAHIRGICTGDIVPDWVGDSVSGDWVKCMFKIGRT